MDNKWLAIKKLVDAQAEDEGLWFRAATAPEAYLQQELRKLHAEIERHLSGKSSGCEIVGCCYYDEGICTYDGECPHR